MTQIERRRYLIDALMKEADLYIEIPEDENDQKELLRALMNIRMPDPIDASFLKIQDEYLTIENQQRGIVDIDSLQPIKKDPRIYLWQGDITTLACDAIVNAANCKLRGCFHPLHNCIDNMIHSYSGIQLRLKCDQIMRQQGVDEPTGHAKITPAYNLPSEYIIHTVGPIIQGKLTKNDERDLKNCYQACLELASINDIKSIAFCCISTGEFHFPNDVACQIAIDTVNAFLRHDKTIEKVIFNVFKDIDLHLYQERLGG